MGRISALTELTSLASDDYLVVLDSSANIAKKISISNAFGIPTFGWTATGESWTYASWTSGTRIGTITVPTDATTKYKAGDRIKITQSTGGTKYGIITKVAATLLTVFFPSGTTLNNEAITSPFYALSGVNPLGFDTNPDNWTMKLESNTNRSQASPTTNTWYNAESLALGIGVWDVWYECLISASGSVNAASPYLTLSTTNNSETDAKWTLRVYAQGAVLGLSTSGRRKLVVLTSASTLYLNMKVDQASSIVQTFASNGHTVIYARCAYI